MSEDNLHDSGLSYQCAMWVPQIAWLSGFVRGILIFWVISQVPVCDSSMIFWVNGTLSFLMSSHLYFPSFMTSRFSSTSYLAVYLSIEFSEILLYIFFGTLHGHLFRVLNIFSVLLPYHFFNLPFSCLGFSSIWYLIKYWNTFYFDNSNTFLMATKFSVIYGFKKVYNS